MKKTEQTNITGDCLSDLKEINKELELLEAKLKKEAQEEEIITYSLDELDKHN